MQYQSTRDKNLKASSAQAILNGLAPDGGLYTMPSFDEVKFRSGDGKTRPRRLYRQV